MNFLGFLLLLIVMSSVEANVRRKRVAGGNQYEDGDYPFHVSLWFMSDNNPYTEKTPNLHHTCGGSLIDRQWVLTSGACFDPRVIDGLNDTSLWYVVLGMYNQTGASEVAKFLTIEKVFFGPEYDLFSSVGDIALLKLTEKAPLGGRIHLVDYNSNDDCPQPGDVAEVIGWGQTHSEEYGLGSNYPHVGDVNITSVEYCNDVYSEEVVNEYMFGIVVNDRHICAGWLNGGIGPCYGDAGSPVLFECDGRTTVVGTVSTGYGCAEPKYPSINTRVSLYSDWITNTIKENW